MAEIALEHLFTITAQTEVAAFMAGCPTGNRVIVNVTGGTFEGPKMKGTVKPPGGDWATMRSDGSLKLDVRILLQTEDGASILMTYSGVGTPDGAGGFSLRTGPTFETGDERYAWLNLVQAVASGAPGEGSVSYEVYAT